MSYYAHLSSIELVRVCSGSNDEEAWAEFIRRFQVVIAAAVLRTARHWGEPPGPLVDDLVQETYLKLCDDGSRLLRSFQPRYEDSIYGFLKVVAAHVVHDHYKSATAAKRDVSRTESITEEAPTTLYCSPDSVEIVDHHLQVDQILKMMVRVTAGKDQERKRTIFWLRYQQGLTASEIASIPSIGLTTEGVESVLMRLAMLIRSHMLGSAPHRKVKVFSRKNRSKRMGT